MNHPTPPTTENTLKTLFDRFPELNVRQIARAMGINESLMHQYTCGAKKPSPDRLLEIEAYLHHLGEALQNTRL